MREIKFRAWDSYLKIMTKNIQMLSTFNEYLSRDKYILMQYTGLKDKNGKEIYEGDIVISIHTGIYRAVKYGLFADDPESQKAKSIGFYVTKECGLGYDVDGEMVFEVIGNIYENPELLNEKT